MQAYTTLILAQTYDFIRGLPETDKQKILAAIKIMETDFDRVPTKSLKGQIRELIVKKYRIVFFIHGSMIYFVGGFIKKTQKTPKNEIEQAESIYKMVR